MKKEQIMLLIFCLSFTKVIYGQYLPIVEEGKYWIFERYNNDDIPDVISGYAITFSGDTLINTLSYKKVYRSTLVTNNPCPPPAPAPCIVIETPYRALNKELISFIREDTQNKKVYNLPLELLNEFCETEEYVVLDYSLQVGDSLNNCVYEAIGGGIDLFGLVDSLGTEDLYNKARETIYTTGYTSYLGLPPAGQIRILEGVGIENYGVFHESRSNLIDFCEGGIEFCEILSSTTSIKEIREVRIFPNPSKGIYQIDLSDGLLQSINIYTMTGELKRELDDSKAIDLNNLEDGVYILELVDKNGGRLTKKIIKEN